MKDGFEESAAFGLGGGELRFKPVAQGHEFIDFGDDAILFGERWDRNRELPSISETDVWLSRHDLRSKHALDRGGNAMSQNQRPRPGPCAS